MPRGRPARAHAPAVKSDLYSWESISRGKLEMGSAPPWVHFLTILCTISQGRPAFSSVPADTFAQPALIHLTHTSHACACACDQVRIKHDGRRFLCLAPRARYNLPLVLPPSTPYHRPPHAAHDPLLSCDGGRPSHGRATLLLSGRLEAYDKFRWRAGGCRGSLAAVLCVIGPQGRQIAPPLAHALPQSSHDLANLFLVAHFLSLPFAGASFAGASRRALFCPCFEGEEWERDLLSII